MAIFYHPKVGEILLCDFQGYEAPEMVKRRPVVVVTERLLGRSLDLLTVVPLSTLEPRSLFPYQIQIELDEPLSPKFSKTLVWAKCDMVAVVAKQRLDRFRISRGADGKIRWSTGQLTKDQVQAIRVGITEGLGLPLDKSAQKG